MSVDHSVSLTTVASRFSKATLLSGESGSHLNDITVIFDGYGSIARPMSEDLAHRGVRRFVLIDPKRYSPQSVFSQCEPEEVGQLKVDIGAARLRSLGAEATSFARDLHSVPEGTVSSDTIVITTVDNRRADIVSNRRAARMGARLIKVNVEPKFEVAAVRAYDFRQETRLCVECQFGGHHYAAQRHPHSCDGSFDGRRTNSPPWLSKAAAHLGILAALDVSADGPASLDWFNHERQFFPKTDVVSDSQLQPKQSCRWDHARRWPNVVRLGVSPSSVSLRDLMQAAEVTADARLRIRFCQRVALRGRCRNCHSDVAVVRWIADLQTDLGKCPDCDSELGAIPFSVFGATSLEPLLAVWDKPLAEWGVEPYAVMEIACGSRSTTFVVGGT